MKDQFSLGVSDVTIGDEGCKERFGFVRVRVNDEDVERFEKYEHKEVILTLETKEESI